MYHALAMDCQSAHYMLRRINRTTFGLKKTSEIEEADLEKFVDSRFSPEEKEEAQVILRDGMINEWNFFRDACNESLIHCPSVIFHYVNQSCLLVFFYELKEFVAQLFVKSWRFIIQLYIRNIH